MAGTREVTIDWTKVDRLLECGNDGKRVAANLGIHPNTLYRRCEEENGISFSDYYAQKRSRGESLILAKQYEMAMKGDKTLLIWVGKQMCGQKEEQNLNASVTLNTINYADAIIPDSSPQVSSQDISTSFSESP